jgi:hypothetical protein
MLVLDFHLKTGRRLLRRNGKKALAQRAAATRALIEPPHKSPAPHNYSNLMPITIP